MAPVGFLLATLPIHAPGLPRLWATVFSIATLLAVVAYGGWTMDGRRGIRWRTPEVALPILVVGLATVEILWAPFPVPAAAEWIRIATGVVLFLIVRTQFRSGEDRESFGIVLAASVASGAFLDLFRYGNAGTGSRDVAFAAGAVTGIGTHETMGTALGLLVPVLLAFATLRRADTVRPLIWQAALLVIGFAWILARCRSAWIGSAFGCVPVLLGMASARISNGKASGPKERIAALLGSSGALVAVGLVFLILAGGIGGAIGARWTAMFTGTLGTVAARVVHWKAAWLLARDAPWFGIGPGAYAVRQGDFTHEGRADWETLSQGADLANNPHSLWMQVLSEQGSVGFAVLAGCLVAWGIAAWRRSRTVSSGPDRATALGFLGTVLCAAISGIASPAFVITPVWVLLCVLAGYALPEEGGDADPARRATTVWVPVLVVASASLALWMVLLNRPIPWASAVSRGRWELVIEAPGGIRPGGAVSWTSRFTASDGSAMATFPGTVWERPWLVGHVRGRKVDAGRVASPLADERVEVRGLRPTGLPGRSTLRVAIPSDLDPARDWQIWVEASFRNVDGAVYRAVAVGPVGTSPIP